MALPRIRKSLDGLPADIAKEYKEVDGQFVLDIEDDDLTPLVTAKNHEKTARQTAETLLNTVRQEKQTLAEQLDEMRRGAIPKADVEGLENSWKTKVADAKTEGEQKATKYQTQLQKVLVKDRAFALAVKISTSPELLAPVIEARLAADEQEGEMVTRVKGADGKMSALTLDDLEKEIRANKSYAPILIGSKGTGGGANGNHNQSPPGGPEGKKFKDLTDQERKDWFNRDPEGFKAAAAQR